MKDSEFRRGDSRATLLEVAVICGFGLFILFWVIPRTTSGTGIGLSPATMPKVAIAATILFVVADGLLRLLRKSTGSDAASTGRSAILIVGGLSVLAGALLTFFGPVVCVLVSLPLLMFSLNERRWTWIACTTFAGALLTYWALR